MVDAFIYMYIVASGAAFGVATVAWISWKVVLKGQKKKARKGAAY